MAFGSGWIPTVSLLSRPPWSDSMGKIELQKKDFVPPPGWHWETPNDDDAWMIKPELSANSEPDDGHDEWLEEVFECQSRRAFRNWPSHMSKSTWIDSVFRLRCKCLQGTMHLPYHTCLYL